MDTTSTKTFFVKRLTRTETPAEFLTGVAGSPQNIDIQVTFVFGSLTGNSKQQNGQTWYEATGTWTFNPSSVTINYGSTGNLKIKLDQQGSTNGWQLKQFIPKANNPAGGPSAASADGNGNIDVTDGNTVAGTYYYGIYAECASDKYYASYDPAIVQDGGGTGMDED